MRNYTTEPPPRSLDTRPYTIQKRNPNNGRHTRQYDWHACWLTRCGGQTWPCTPTLIGRDESRPLSSYETVSGARHRYAFRFGTVFVYPVTVFSVTFRRQWRHFMWRNTIVTPYADGLVSYESPRPYVRGIRNASRPEKKNRKCITSRTVRVLVMRIRRTVCSSIVNYRNTSGQLFIL